MTEQNLDHAQVMVPPPLVFLGYLIGALVVNWAVPFPEPWIFAFRIIGAVMVVAGFFLAGSAISQMRKSHTSPDPHQPVNALVTSGPYRFTRNPIYLGFLLIYLGFTMAAGTWWGWLGSPFLIWSVTNSVIQPEEVYLDDKFEEQYKEYCSRVRRWI